MRSLLVKVSLILAVALSLSIAPAAERAGTTPAPARRSSRLVH